MTRIIVHNALIGQISLQKYSERMFQCFEQMKKKMNCTVEFVALHEIDWQKINLSSVNMIVIPEYYPKDRALYYKLRLAVSPTCTIVCIYVCIEDISIVWEHDRLFDIGFAMNKSTMLHFMSNCDSRAATFVSSKFLPAFFPFESECFSLIRVFEQRFANAFLYAGRVNEYKFIVKPIENILKITEKKLFIQGVLCSQSQEYVKEFEDFCINNKVEITGNYVKDNITMRDIYNQYRYVLLYSKGDIYSFFILEAMACGCIPFVYNRGVHNYLRWIADVDKDVYKELVIFDEEQGQIGSKDALAVAANKVQSFLDRPLSEQIAVSRRLSDFAGRFSFESVFETYFWPALSRELL